MSKKSIFSYNADIDKTAYLNWRTSPYDYIFDMRVMADGYFMGAEVMLNDCLNNNGDKRADAMIFPILFAVNHGIELYEKALYWILNIFLKNKKTYSENHNIKGLWDAVKQKVYEFGFEEPYSSKGQFDKMSAGIETYIKDIYDKINIYDDINEAYCNMDFSRYPLNIKKDKHFYIAEKDNVVIDLEFYLKTIKEIHRDIDCLFYFYYGIMEESWQSENY